VPSFRAGLALLTALLLLLGLPSAALSPPAAAQGRAAAVPQAECGPGSRPETDLQGRIPPADVASGRAAAGYTCNTEQVGSFATTRRVSGGGCCATATAPTTTGSPAASPRARLEADAGGQSSTSTT